MKSSEVLRSVQAQLSVVRIPVEAQCRVDFTEFLMELFLCMSVRSLHQGFSSGAL